MTPHTQDKLRPVAVALLDLPQTLLETFPEGVADAAGNFTRGASAGLRENVN
ncbi:hypothetical protein KMZ68_15760 [Bradyrhizobium sediminis]|uniref:Uncharacterized protein n=1 Tax=Bradyrhizobium sediminis TaxID=2840469 RepID=A0A975NKF4_9BRAD|nr:hypothetical protein [Bradyrhizobium sediminis]QWG16460.1 hypothetical protein KMZ68_15760 [Bradyrhizobium sediminis]